MSNNLSKYTKTSLVFASTSAFPGSTGTASLSDAQGFPLESTSLDMAGYDGVRFVATFDNTTGGGIAAYTAASSTVAIASWTAISGATISMTTANAGYSTAITALVLDVVKPRNRWIAVTASVASTSGVLTAIVADQYGGRSEAQGLGTYLAGSTVAVSLST